MSKIADISILLISLIRAGAAMRVLYCFIRLAGADEEQGLYRKRIRNVLVFYCIAESVWTIKELMIQYFS